MTFIQTVIYSGYYCILVDCVLIQYVTVYLYFYFSGEFVCSPLHQYFRLYVKPSLVPPSPARADASARCGVAVAGKFITLRFLAEDICRLTHLAELGLLWDLAFNRREGAERTWPPRSLSTTELPCRGSGVRLCRSWVEFPPLDAAYWPNVS